MHASRPFSWRCAPDRFQRTRPSLGVALLDVSTGEFTATEYAGLEGLQALADEFAVLRPREVIVPGDAIDRRRNRGGGCGRALADDGGTGLPMTPVDAWAFDREAARRALLDQLRAGGLEGFGLDRQPAAVAAAGALVHYLRGRPRKPTSRMFGRLRIAQRADALLIDPTTLGIWRSSKVPKAAATVLCSMNSIAPITSMGSRLLRSWLLRPLLSLDAIRDRLDARRGPRVPDDRARQVPRRRSKACRISSGWSRGQRSEPPVRAIWSG